jgi:DNA-binding MarR family transcriptional regulator
MNRKFSPAGWIVAAAIAIFSVAPWTGTASAAMAKAPSAKAHAKFREALAAMQRGQVYFVRDKAIRPSSCWVSPAYVQASTPSPLKRCNKSKIRAGMHWGLQRSARRGSKQAQGSASAKVGPPEVLDQLRQVMRALRREEGRTGRTVTAAAQRAVACIDANPGIQVGDLARELCIHQSTASNLLERLTREGLVAKRRTVDDYRTVSLFATAKGRAALKSAPPPGDRLQRALARLPASSLAVLNAHLKGLVDEMLPEDLRQA